MKKLLCLFFVLPFVTFSQNLELIKATEQTINHGVSPSSSTNYAILLKKSKSFNWSIDSIYSIADTKKVTYNIATVDDLNLASPNYKKLEKFEKKHIGFIQITFSTLKYWCDDDGRKVQHIEKKEQNDYSAGIQIFYSTKDSKFKIRSIKKLQKLTIDSFEKLETIDAP